MKASFFFAYHHATMAAATGFKKRGLKTAGFAKYVYYDTAKEFVDALCELTDDGDAELGDLALVFVGRVVHELTIKRLTFSPDDRELTFEGINGGSAARVRAMGDFSLSTNEKPDFKPLKGDDPPDDLLMGLFFDAVRRKPLVKACGW